jgi:hypothetical protein
LAALCSFLEKRLKAKGEAKADKPLAFCGTLAFSIQHLVLFGFATQVG